MRQRILLLCLLPVLVWFNGYAQSINRYEYFIDTDPGLGKGNSFSVPLADSIAIDLPLNVTGLSTGFHLVCIRAMDNNGSWGHAEFRQLLIQPLPVVTDQGIIKAEYFFNTDPGPGSGIAVTFNMAD